MATEKVVQAKSALKSAQAERDAIFKQIVAGKNKKIPTVPEALVLETEPVGNGSATDRILALLSDSPDKVFTYAEIFKALPDVKHPTVRALLFNLRHEEKVSKHGRGKWKAA